MNIGSVSASPLASSFGEQTRVVRLVSTVNAFVQIGTAPVATALNMFIPAYSPEYFTVNPQTKVSGLSQNLSGTLYITEMTQ
jgi:hypothetical protein